MTDPLPLPSAAPHDGAAAPGRSLRRLAMLAAAAAFGAAVSPGIAALPAAAATPECGTAGFHADAGADLLRLDLLDLHPLLVDLGPVSKVRVAPTTAGTRGGDHGRSAADARYLIAKLLGVQVPTGPLAADAHQESPPINPRPVTVNPGHVNLGALAVGSGSLTAHTTWPARPHCPPSPGATAEAKASVLDATVLPALNGALVRLPDTASTTSTTGVVRRRDRLDPTATAAASLTELQLLHGTTGEITVRVVSPPTLTVVAGRSRAGSTVAYTAPVLDVTLPGGHHERLDSLHKQVDIPVPDDIRSARSVAAAADPLLSLVRRLPEVGHITSAASATGTGTNSLASNTTEGGAAGLLGNVTGGGSPVGGIVGGGSPVGGIEGGVTGGGSPVGGIVGGATGGGSPVGGIAGGLTGGSPAGGAVGGVTGGGKARATGGSPGASDGGGRHGTVREEPAPADHDMPDSIVRLSIGALSTHITDGEVHAEASSLRVQVLTKKRSAGGYGGPGSTCDSSVLDLGVGVLSATAGLAGGSGYGDGGGYGGGTGGDQGGSGGGVPVAGTGHAPGGTGGGGGTTATAASLPVTGPGVALVAGGATLLLVVGRLLMIVTRRRGLLG